MDDARDPSLTGLLEAHAEVMLDNVNVMLPGKVVSYDAAKQTAVVQPLVKKRHLAEDGEGLVAEDMPPIHGCPVEFCGPARGRITWPVAAGDSCEIRFASASLARWAALAPGTPVDPGDDRRHDLSDAVCFVGLHSPGAPPTDAPTDAVVIHVSGGVAIKLGSSGAAQAAVLGNTYRTAEDIMINALKVFVAAVSTHSAPWAPTRIRRWSPRVLRLRARSPRLRAERPATSRRSSS
jgi:hypothetical protein